MDLGYAPFCKYLKLLELTLKSMGHFNGGTEPTCEAMRTHKIKWYSEIMQGIALIFGTNLFMHFFS